MEVRKALPERGFGVTTSGAGRSPAFSSMPGFCIGPSEQTPGVEENAERRWSVPVLRLGSPAFGKAGLRCCQN
jgi:hypothetical protein